MVTFQPATNKMTSYLPMNFDDGRHILKLVKLEDTNHEQYGAGFKWVWRLAKHPSKEQIVDDRGMPFEFWQFTGSSLGINKKTGGPTEGRKNVEALLGRPLQEGELIDDELLLNKYALGLVILDEKERLKISKIEPYRSGGKGTVTTAAPPDEPPDDVLADSLEVPEGSDDATEF